MAETALCGWWELTGLASSRAPNDLGGELDGDERDADGPRARVLHARRTTRWNDALAEEGPLEEDVYSQFT